jgi:hypothetical protein
MLLQLEPGMKEIGNKEKSIKYLSQYFDKKQFDVDWTNPEKFIRKLWIEWDEYRTGRHERNMPSLAPGRVLSSIPG